MRRASPVPRAGTHAAPAAAAGGTEPQDKAPKPQFLPGTLLSYSDLSGDSGALLNGTGWGGVAVNLWLPCIVFFCFPSLQLIWIGCPLPLLGFMAGICYKHRALTLMFWWSFKACFYYGMAHAKASYYKQHNGNRSHLMGEL